MRKSADILDDVMRQGLKPAPQRRVDDTLGKEGEGSLGDFLKDILKQIKVPPGAEAPEGLPQRSPQAPPSTPPEPQQPRKGGFLEDLLGGLLGMGKKQAPPPHAEQPKAPPRIEQPKAPPPAPPASKPGLGWVKGGALAVIGALALRALMKKSNKSVASLQADGNAQLLGGLRPPANEQEAQQLEQVSSLLLRSMINAAKADGQVDQAEMQRIMGNLQQGGISAEEKEFFLDELQKPMETDAIVRMVPNEQVAAQVYAASVMAIDVNTEAEKNYLADLARKLKVDAGVAREIGVPAGYDF